MFIIGCDFHSRFQQIVMLDPTTGEVIERPLEHENGEAKKFYATLPSPARVGMEATFDAQWFERMLREHNHELWIGEAAEIRAAMVRKQKTDSRDALHILDLCSRTVFPGSGCRRRRSETCGRCCGIGTSWFAFIPR
jgi:transposase